MTSNHVYLGDEEENEVDDEVLQSVEASGGLLQAVAMAQQQQQAQAAPAGQMGQPQPNPFEALLEQQRAGKNRRAKDASDSGSDSSSEEEGAPRASAGPVSKRAPPSTSKSSPPKSAAADSEKKKSGGFFSRLFGSSSSASANEAPSKLKSKQRKEKESASGGRGSVPNAPPPPAASSFLNFINRQPASRAPQPMVGFDPTYGGRMPLRMSDIPRVNPRLDNEPTAQPSQLAQPMTDLVHRLEYGGRRMLSMEELQARASPVGPPPPPMMQPQQQQQQQQQQQPYPQQQPYQQKQQPPQPLKKKNNYNRKIDTNILAIKFSTLSAAADDVFAGDAILCADCGAALSQLSTIVDHNNNVVSRATPASSSASSSSSAAPVAPAAPQMQSQVAPGGLKIAPEPSQAAGASSAPAPALSQRAPLPVPVEEGQMLWVCDFCAHPNVMDELAAAEIPSQASRDYVLEPAPIVEGAQGSGSNKEASDQSFVIFLLDISGSMCVSAPVQGKHKLKGAREIDPALLAFADVDRTGLNSNITYISRLQAVQASIDSQLTALAKSHPNQRVLLITFNGEVTIVGDGAAGASVVITGDKLTQEAELQRIGREYAIGRSISQSREELSAALFSLEETGPTALGPALVTAISIASRQRGSTVIVCTDGLANVGVGSMSDRSLSQEQLEGWYQARGVEAREAGVTVSVLSIKGDECRLEALGLVAAETLGQVQRVDPTNLVNNFASILQNPVIATQVAVTFFLHKGMQFRGAEVDAALASPAPQPQQSQPRRKMFASKAAPPAPAAPAAAASSAPAPAVDLSAQSKLTRNIGNVTADSETALEYGLRDRAQLEQYAHLRALPFQCQITFTTLSGMRALRVLTQSQAVTMDRAVAERDAKIELVSAQVASKSAALARAGHYREARRNWIAATPMLSRAAQQPQQQQAFANYASNIDVFDKTIAAQQRAEENAGGGLSESDDDDEAAAPGGGSRAPRMQKKYAQKKSKKAALSDESYRVIHATHQLNSAGLM